VPNIKVIEVVSGLGLGGAEKALISRLRYKPDSMESTILNIRPQIDSLKHPSSINYFENKGNFAQTIIYLYNKIRQIHPDIVIVRTPADVIRLVIVKKLLHSELFLVFEAHSNFITKRRYLNKTFHLFFNLASSQLNAIFAVSKSVKNGPLCRAFKNTQVCYLGSDIEIDRDLLREINDVKFLFIGRMVDVKRPLWLIDRIDNLRKRIQLQEFSFTIVGDGPLLKKAKDLAEARGLSDYVTFAGEQADVVPFLLQHNYLVSCSENEGLPITFYEAKLAGLRIISTPSGGGHEIFGENDVLTSGFNELEFEDALITVLTEPTPSMLERNRTASASVWMSAQMCSVSYYKNLFKVFESGTQK
jgi:glycosyltransferase involved in cell wall biosynthesis